MGPSVFSMSVSVPCVCVCVCVFPDNKTWKNQGRVLPGYPRKVLNTYYVFVGTGLQTVIYESTLQFPSDLVRDANFMFVRLSVTSPVYLPNWQVFLRKWEWREWKEASNLLPPPCCYFVFSNVKYTWQEGGWSTPRATVDSSLKDVFVVL